MALPPKLVKAVEERLCKPGFNSYKLLAEWIWQEGHRISVTNLKRLRVHLTEKGRPARSVKAQKLSRPWSGTTEGLMQLTQQKLGSALAEIRQLEEGDVSRLAHAVAHLTQAGISLQRWNHQLNQQAGERARPETGSKVRGGLSPQTSQALRNALLGIAPFDAEKIGPPKPVPDEREPSLLTISRVVDEVREPQKSNATAAADALKRGDQFDNEDDL